jgi:signal peptidase I
MTETPSSAPTPNQPPKSLARRFWDNWLKPIGMVVLVITTFRSAVADWNDVPSQSMEPTILVGDRIFVNKLAYDLKFPFTTWHIAEWSKPQAGDVVIFYSPADGKRMVKRVIGVPGDRIELRDNQLLINGKAIKYESTKQQSIDIADLTDPAPHVFALEKLGDQTHSMMVQPRSPAKQSAWRSRSTPPTATRRDGAVFFADSRRR